MLSAEAWGNLGDGSIQGSAPSGWAERSRRQHVTRSDSTTSAQPWLHSAVAMGEARVPGEWVLLTYRMPRDPSTPRISVWRKLKGLGVAQLADGLVALPADARTREQLEWVAEQVRQADGVASVWLARPTTPAQERELAAGMAAARRGEYQQVRAEATEVLSAPVADRLRTQRRLRGDLRRIRRRDYFPPLERDGTVAAVEALGTGPAADGPPPTSTPGPTVRQGS